MIEEARNARDATLIAVAFDAGARSGELRDLTVGDVSDAENGLRVFVDGKRDSAPYFSFQASPTFSVGCPTIGGVKLSRNRQAAAELSGDGNSPFLLVLLSV